MVAAVDAAVTTYGAIDVVVNKPWGGGSICRVERKSDQELRAGMEIGYLAPFWAMQAAFPQMHDRGWGRVINMVSLNGVNAQMGSLEHNAAKEALWALTRVAGGRRRGQPDGPHGRPL